VETTADVSWDLADSFRLETKNQMKANAERFLETVEIIAISAHETTKLLVCFFRDFQNK
jgi:hypothetical protein